MASSSATIQLLLDLQDNISAGLKTASDNVAGFGKKVEDLKPAFEDMAKVGAIGFAAVGAAIYTSIDAYNDQEAAVAQLGAVLKSTGGQAGITAQAALDLSSALQKTTTYADETILGGENLLLTFTNIGKDVFPQATQTMLDMSAALGQDLKSSAVQLGKALNDPVVGITALQRVGVSFTQSQKDMIQSMVDAGKTEEAQKLILAELTKEFGGSAAAAAGTFAGKVEQLKNSLNDMQESVGGALISILTDMAKKIQPIVEAMVNWVNEHPKLTAAILLITAGIFGLIAVIGTLGLLLVGLVGFFTSVGTIAAAVGGVLGLISLPMLAIVAAIALVIAAGVLLYQHWAQVSAFATEVWNGIVATITGAMNAVVSFLSAVWETIEQIFFTAVDLLIGSWATLLDFFFPGWEAALSSVYQATLQIFGLIGAFITSTLASLGAGIQSALDLITGAWNTAWSAVADAFSTIWEGIKGVAQSAFDYISSGVNSVLSPLQKVIDIANKAYDAAKRAIDLIGSGVKSVISKGASITGHATGGPVLRGTPYIVGEHGPEMFVPGGSGSIIPNRMLGAAAVGGGTINISLAGGQFLDRDAARKFGAELVRYLKDNRLV